MTTPLISCIMLIGKSNIDIINRCINSFNKQTYPNKELIIVNNHRTQLQNSHIMIDNPDTIVIDTPVNLTAGMARNYGIQAANGQILVQYDPEYIWHKDRLLIQATSLSKTESHISVLSKTNTYSFITRDIGTYSNNKKCVPNTMMFIRSTIDYPDIDKGEEFGILERMTTIGLKCVSIDNQDIACKLYGHDYPRTTVKINNYKSKCAKMIRDWLK